MTTTPGQQSSHVQDEFADEAACDGNDAVLGGEGAESLGGWGVGPDMRGPSHNIDVNMMDVDGAAAEEEGEGEGEGEGAEGARHQKMCQLLEINGIVVVC